MPSRPRQPGGSPASRKDPKTTEIVEGHRAAASGALIIGLAALSMFMTIQPGWLVELLTGSPSTAIARGCGAIAELVVSQAAIVLVLFAHFEMSVRRRISVSPWKPRQLLEEALSLMALFTLWMVCLSMVVMGDATNGVHILDFVGRAGALGAVVGLGIVAWRGTFRYGRALALLPWRLRSESILVLVVLAAAFSPPTYAAIWTLATVSH